MGCRVELDYDPGSQVELGNDTANGCLSSVPNTHPSLESLQCLVRALHIHVEIVGENPCNVPDNVLISKEQAVSPYCVKSMTGEL